MDDLDIFRNRSRPVHCRIYDESDECFVLDIVLGALTIKPAHSPGLILQE
jgi:hypothetical protein